MASRAAAVQVSGLVKTYGDVRAVDGLDLHVEAGTVVAILGPNGAGKTTTVEILEGYRRRDGGEVQVLGLDPETGGSKLKSRIGIVLQATGVDRYLTVAESIAMFAGYYEHPRPVAEVIDLVGLAGKRDSRVIKLSGGQQRRLDVAIALAGDPELLFLDEPTTGFDPSARHEAWDVVRNLRALGKTVVLTTHYMDEAQALADQVVVVARGQVVATGTPQTLGGRESARPTLTYRLGDRVTPPRELGEPVVDSDRFVLRPPDLTRALHELTGWALDHGVELQHLDIERPSLEDVYLRLTEDGGPNR